MSERSASLTASSVGKADRTSGARSARFVPARYLFRYLARTPPLSLVRSYSGRRSLSFETALPFFILLSLFANRLSSTDDAGAVVAISMRDYQHPSLRRVPKCNEPVLIFRMIRVVIGDG